MPRASVQNYPFCAVFSPNWVPPDRPFYLDRTADYQRVILRNETGGGRATGWRTDGRPHG
jgi:hypothetical protein